MKIDIKKAILLKRNNYIEITLNNGNYADILDNIAGYIKKGYSILQINQGTFCDNSFLKIAKDLRQISSLYDSLLIIKNRADIARLSQADGIILDNNAINIFDCKKIIDENILIGKYLNSDIDCCDFILTDKNEIKSDIPAYLKISTKDNINIYEVIQNGNN